MILFCNLYFLLVIFLCMFFYVKKFFENMIHNSPWYPPHNLCIDFLIVGHLGGFQEITILQSHFCHIKYQAAILERCDKNFLQLWVCFS